MNSFCHKDYASGQSNEVAIYKDRVEIYNPGAFPEGYEPQDFIEKAERPIRRNPIIARILYYSKDIESFGTGLKRISEACDAAGVRYEFKKLKSGFVVCFYRAEENIIRGEAFLHSEKATEILNKKISEVKNDAIVRIVEYLDDNNMITTDIGVEITGKSVAQVRRYLKILCDMGAIKKTKSTKGNVYVHNK